MLNSPEISGCLGIRDENPKMCQVMTFDTVDLV